MPRFDEYTTPDCCPEIKESRAVFLSVQYESDRDEGKPATQKWVTRAPSHHESFEHPSSSVIVQAQFCPHCGKPLPQIGPRETSNHKICQVSDGGYYCDTCKESLNTCECYPLTAAFQALPSDDAYEIHLIATLISLAPGYAVDLFGGTLQVCRLESGRFYIYANAEYDDDVGDDPRQIAARFMEIRRQRKLGYDFEIKKAPQHE